MVGFGELTGYIAVEAALDELFLEDISDVMHACSDIDWKPKEGWKHSQHVVP
jgi:alpha-D-ribose 1-methylphosphonate 5-phosphate C-P lyase